MNITIGMISRAALAAALVTAQAARADDPAPAPAAPADGPGGVAADDEVIVTGTRAIGITAAESAAPIKLLGSEAIEHIGQPNLNQVLTQLIPSFNAAAFGGHRAAYPFRPVARPQPEPHLGAGQRQAPPRHRQPRGAFGRQPGRRRA